MMITDLNSNKLFRIPKKEYREHVIWSQNYIAALFLQSKEMVAFGQ